MEGDPKDITEKGHIELEESPIPKDSSLYPDPDEMTIEVEKDEDGQQSDKP